MHNFRELKIWKIGIEVSKSVFVLTKSFPSEEKYSLVAQLVRCAVSIPSNIAEGCGRKSAKELSQFLSISLGSAFELETQLIISNDFNYIEQTKFDDIVARVHELQKMIIGFQNSLNT